MGYSSEYQGFVVAAAKDPQDKTTRLAFADNCDDDPAQAGGSSQISDSARGALVRVQLAIHEKSTPELLEQQAQLIATLRPMLLAEIEQVDGWQRHIGTGRNGNVQSITNEQLAQIFERGMVSRGKFDGRHKEGEDPMAHIARQIPLTKIALTAGEGSTGWVNAERVARLPAVLTEVSVGRGALPDKAAQDALFAHPGMEHVQQLCLAPPSSAAQELFYVDLGLASVVSGGRNPTHDHNVEMLDADLVRRLTGGKLGKELKRVEFDYGLISDGGMRALLGADKLRGTVIEFTGGRRSEVAGINGQNWAQQVSPQVWRDVVVHNYNAARSQGTTYELPTPIRDTLNDNRSTGQWLRRKQITSVEDVLRREVRSGTGEGEGRG